MSSRIYNNLTVNGPTPLACTPFGPPPGTAAGRRKMGNLNREGVFGEGCGAEVD